MTDRSDNLPRFEPVAAWPERRPRHWSAPAYDENGALVGYVLPATPLNAPADVRRGITALRMTYLDDECPECGARVLYGSRQERRDAAATGRAPAGAPHVHHRRSCPASDRVLTEAVARWEKQDGAQ